MYLSCRDIQISLVVLRTRFLVQFLSSFHSNHGFSFFWTRGAGERGEENAGQSHGWWGHNCFDWTHGTALFTAFLLQWVESIGTRKGDNVRPVQCRQDSKKPPNQQWPFKELKMIIFRLSSQANSYTIILFFIFLKLKLKNADWSAEIWGATHIFCSEQKNTI